MGKARRLQKQQTVAGPSTASEQGGESFYGQDDGPQKIVSVKTKQVGAVTKTKRLSAKKRKQLQKVVEKKEKAAKRSQLLDDLKKVAILPEHSELMIKTAQFSTTENNRLKLKRELKEFDAGILNAEDASHLFKKRKKEEEEEAKEAKKEQLKVRLAAPSTAGGGFLAYAANVMKTAAPLNPESSSESDSEDDDDSDEDDDDVDEVDENNENNENNDNIKDINNVGEKSEEEAINGSNDTATVSTISNLPRKTHKEENEEERSNMPRDVVKKMAQINPVFVTINRPEDIKTQRAKLPISSDEFTIMESIRENLVTVLCGETGSGKTTQLPQFLYEAGFGSGTGIFPGLIGVTEPRRVAAVSMAERVGYELTNPALSGYQIRYAGTVTSNTKIKFMTDGVLLKEIERDFLLKKYSVVVIDEAHERSLNTDVLIGLLSRIVNLRKEMSDNNEKNVKPFRLVIMSATLRVEDFTGNNRLFSKPPPVVKTEGRTYPVTVHFNRRTPHDDYLEEAFKKVCKLHSRLPAGGILIFMPSQREIVSLVHKLKKKYPRENMYESKKRKDKFKTHSKNDDNDDEESEQIYDKEEEEALLDQDDNDTFSSDDDDDDDDTSLPKSLDETSEPLYVLPLYSLLPQHQQMKVFEEPPAGTRLCVVATNVAETSLTIPNIRYVIDTGKVKEKRFESGLNAISRLDVQWISQAAADQRAGRAGRTGPGHCYRLYSSAVFTNYFEKFSDPEILRLPVDGVVLQMKAMGIDNVVNFPFPTPPEKESLENAERLLISLNAVDSKTKQITKTGLQMSKFPLAPRFAKLLVFALENREILPYVIVIASALTVGKVFVTDTDGNNAEGLDMDDSGSNTVTKAVKKRWFGKSSSDLLVLLNAVGAYEYSNGDPGFCHNNYLREKSMKEIRKLRWQLTNIVNTLSDANCVIDPHMRPPSKQKEMVLWQAFLSAFGDQIARRFRIKSGSDEDVRATKHTYKGLNSDDLLHIHSSSAVYNSLPEWIIFTELSQAGGKTYMKEISKILPSWIPKLAPSLCSFSKPRTTPPPFYDQEKDDVLCTISANVGIHGWEIAAQELPFPADNIDRYKVFAMALLQGEVIPEFEVLVPYLVASPVVLLKVWTQERIIAITGALGKYQVCSKESLLKQWQTDSKFLLEPLSLWIKKPQHTLLIETWKSIKRSYGLKAVENEK